MAGLQLGLTCISLAKATVGLYGALLRLLMFFFLAAATLLCLQSHPKLVLGGVGLLTLGGALWWR